MTKDDKPRKLLFHIGDHKTGTTSIQNAFARQDVTLDAGRILYPARMSHNYLPNHFEAYIDEARVIPGSPGRPGLGKIAERLQSESFDYAVISGEQFEGADPIMMHKVLDHFWLPHVSDYAVICYLRPHAARTLSSFAENVKLGLYSGNPEGYFEKTLASRRFFYLPRMAALSDQFDDKFKLRPMIRSELAGGSVLSDFIKTGFSPEASVKVREQQAANESLCLEDLLLVNLIQARLQLRHRTIRHAMGWELATTLGEAKRNGAQGTKLAIDKRLAERIRITYWQDAEDIDTRYFAGRSLFRAELDRAVDEALPVGLSFDPSDHFNADTLRIIDVLSSEINVLIGHESGPWPEFLQSKRVAKTLGEQGDEMVGAKKRALREGRRKNGSPAANRRKGSAIS